MQPPKKLRLSETLCILPNALEFTTENIQKRIVYRALYFVGNSKGTMEPE